MSLDLCDATLIAMISRMAEQHMTDPQIAIIIDADPNHVRAFREHHKIKSGFTRKYMAGNREDDKRGLRWESDGMAEKFAGLMAGRSFANDVHTKSYGRQHNPEPCHVRTESGLARCG